MDSKSEKKNDFIKNNGIDELVQTVKTKPNGKRPTIKPCFPKKKGGNKIRKNNKIKNERKNK